MILAGSGVVLSAAGTYIGCSFDVGDLCHDILEASFILMNDILECAVCEIQILFNSDGGLVAQQ